MGHKIGLMTWNVNQFLVDQWACIQSTNLYWLYLICHFPSSGALGKYNIIPLTFTKKCIPLVMTPCWFLLSSIKFIFQDIWLFLAFSICDVIWARVKIRGTGPGATLWEKVSPGSRRFRVNQGPLWMNQGTLASFNTWKLGHYITPVGPVPRLKKKKKKNKDSGWINK